MNKYLLITILIVILVIMLNKKKKEKFYDNNYKNKNTDLFDELLKNILMILDYMRKSII